MIYDKIKSLAKQKGVSIAKIERDLDFGSGSICKWNRVMPTSGSLMKVANYLDVPIEEFLIICGRRDL
ncbi:helix-turn-helix domain-containing protein [Listeria fleischmannii]|uniref:helix-turn-helix domain-containing protein n=1 Tax=Listeria fleischmannii TaxID=1069827 RepID=UPI001624FFA5|nr:helix-turn-helix domain-containing protein [Listeria fleischmannii]MBC1420178.1 helix-turn-helix transcriptional regulator [Listeria fleischmannii]